MSLAFFGFRLFLLLAILLLLHVLQLTNSKGYDLSFNSFTRISTHCILLYIRECHGATC